MHRFKPYIGDKKFYMLVLGVAIPIMIQNGITNFVSLLDNIMVGRVGTEQMSGVAIVNQIFLIYNLCIFGGVSGAGIFTAQYYGQKNDEGVRNTFRFKLWISGIITFLAILIFAFFHRPLIMLYLQGDQGGQNMEAALEYGMRYVKIMLIGLPPFMMVQSYSSTLRETGETVLPMKAGIAAVLVNLVFNYILIYGKFGVPALGVSGAAAATVLSRYVEAGIVILWTHSHTDILTFAKGLYRTLKVPLNLAKKIMIKGTPLLVNETLWAAGVAVLMQCYSIRGLDVVAGMNISNTIANLFNVAFIALGDSVAIIVGQLLGAGKMKEAKETDRKLIAFSVALCFVIGTVMAVVAAPLFPHFYNTTEQVKNMACIFIVEAACFMPMNAFLHATYFTLRSGGKTIITFFFDGVYVWVVNVSLAFLMSRFTNLSIYYIYFLVTAADLIKCVIGYILVKKGVWLQNIVKEA